MLGIKIHGVDVSKYAIENAKPEVKNNLQLASAAELPYADQSFDLVVSIATLHNQYCYDLELLLSETERVGKKHKYVVVESYRTEEEKANYYTGNQHVNRFTPRKNESSGLQNAIILVIIH